MKGYGFLFLLLFWAIVLSGQQVGNYQAYCGWGIIRKSNLDVILIREFSRENHMYFLTVSPQTLVCKPVRSDSLSIFPINRETLYSRFSSTPYIKALKMASANSKAIQDAGLKRFRPSMRGINLTIDLCPSHRPLDRFIFTDLISEFSTVERPVPLAISVTGQWMNQHPDDLNWLLGLVKSGDLSILWINHSYNHFVSKDVPLTKNFLLAPGTDINAEVLNTEKAMLEQNILPSVFFRFPGLVSNQSVFDQIIGFGLIPVGSDAWLAKGQWPEDGSIVLIHANGNEQLGVKDFINLIRTKKSKVLSRQWELFDLRQSLVQEENH